MRTFASVLELFEHLPQAEWPNAAIVGLPPSAHGTTLSGRDCELLLAGARMHLFIEKPLSAYPPGPDYQNGETGPVREQLHALVRGTGLVSSVGYMFRYSTAVQRLRDIIREVNRPVSLVSLRYNCGYSPITKAGFWDVRQSGGPVVEQATHFVDLARYLVGSEADLSSVAAQCVEASDPNLGPLDDIATNPSTGKSVEAAVPIAWRMPRVTVATWRFHSGAVATLHHAIQLHKASFSAELEIVADGLRAVLVEPYSECPQLRVRRPFSEDEEVLAFPQPYVVSPRGRVADDLLNQAQQTDPYFVEMRVFIDAVKQGRPELIRCSFDDAWETYELTWAIRRAAERSSAAASAHRAPAEMR